MADGWIAIRGASVHNLQQVDVDLPKGRLVAITSVSRSGKSSLAHDTLFAEGQRRFLESLSVSARAAMPRGRRPRSATQCTLDANTSRHQPCHRRTVRSHGRFHSWQATGAPVAIAEKASTIGAT